MTYKTLSTIHAALKQQVESDRYRYDTARRELTDFEKLHDIPWQYREDFSKLDQKLHEKYGSLVFSYIEAQAMKTESESALFEFDNQDWR